MPLLPRKIKILPRLKLVLLFALLAVYPGQNRFQLLETHPSGSQIKGLSVDLGASQLPYWNGIDAPALTAQAVVVFEPVSGTILFERNLEEALPPASTTKIMTALVALDSYSLNSVLQIKNAPTAIGSSMKLKAGEQMTVRNLMYGLLVASANDAALTLAENFPAGYDEFVVAMNRKAGALNLSNTHFANVSGLEEENHYTTVRDLVILSKEAFKNPFFRELVSTSAVTISDVDNTHQYQLATTNELLGKVDGVAGVKTGWTEAAGECLVTYVERDGKRLFIALLGSADRFGETKQLIEWSYIAHSWKSL